MTDLARSRRLLIGALRRELHLHAEVRNGRSIVWRVLIQRSKPRKACGTDGCVRYPVKGAGTQ